MLLAKPTVTAWDLRAQQTLRIGWLAWRLERLTAMLRSDPIWNAAEAIAGDAVDQYTGHGDRVVVWPAFPDQGLGSQPLLKHEGVRTGDHASVEEL